MNTVKLILFYETNFIVVYILLKLTFRFTGYKDVPRFGIVFLLINIYNDFKSYLSENLFITLQKIENILENPVLQSQVKAYLPTSNRYIEIFGERYDTIPEREDITRDIGMSAKYEKTPGLCTLNDIYFGKLKTNLTLNFSEKEMLG